MQRELLDQLRAACEVSDHKLAISLPPGAYCSPELFELEKRCVLEAGWQAICRVEQVADLGSYYSVDLLGIPLVVTRDELGELRVLSRTCRHRMMDVVEGAGRASALRCPFHLWTYGLDGRLTGAPLMQGVSDFKREHIHLPQVRHEVWQGFVFTNLDGNAPRLSTELSGLTAQIENYGLERYRLVDASDWVCRWDWKIMVENFMECYHHLGVHASSIEPTFPARATWSGVGGDYFSVLHVPRKHRVDDPVPTLPGSGQLTEIQRSELLVFAIYPHFVAALGPGYLYWLRMLPTGAGELMLQVQICLSEPTLSDPQSDFLRRELVSDIIATHREDIAICEAVQRAARSRLSESGRLSSLEQPLWEFYRYLGRGFGFN